MARDPKLSLIRSELRRISLRGRGLSKARTEAKGRARIKIGVYRCEGCGQACKKPEVDHVIPCGELKTWDDLSGWAERLFCDADGLRVLCRECHHAKTHKGKQ